MATDWRELNEKGYLSSLWLMDREDDRPLDFHGAFIPQVAEGLIRRHTKPGDWVWDPMAGSGTTAVANAALDKPRNVVLSDLTPRFDDYIGGAHCYRGDARIIRLCAVPNGEPCPVGNLKRYRWYDTFQFDLVILHPPYHDIIQFSNKPGDLSNCEAVSGFLRTFHAVCKNVNRHLKPGGYIGLVIGDIWQDAQHIPLGFYCMEIALCALGDGARCKSIVVKDIKNNRHNAGRRNLMLSRLARWGGVEFKHEYIFSIQKEK